MAKPFTHICHGCGNGIPHDAEATGNTVSCPYCAVATELGKIYPTSEMSRVNPWDESEEASPEQTAEITAQAHQSPPPIPRKDPDSTADVGESEQSIRGRSVLKREQPVKANTEGGSLLFLRGFLLTLLGVAAGFVLGFDYQDSISPAVTNPSTGELNPVLGAFNVFVGCCGAAIGGVIGILSHLVWKEFTKQDKDLPVLIVSVVVLGGGTLSLWWFAVTGVKIEHVVSTNETKPNKPVVAQTVTDPTNPELVMWQNKMTKEGLEKVNQLPIPIQLALKGRATKDGEGNISMSFRESKIDDLSGINALPITELDLDHTGIRNLKPLAGLKLRVLKLWDAGVTDLRPLSGMPLNILFIHSPVADLEPLRGMPLTNLGIASSAVSDISSLAGMKLTKLSIESDRLVSLASLRGQPIENLELVCPSISDLSPLLECRQLKRLTIHPNLNKRAGILRRHPSLTNIVN